MVFIIPCLLVFSAATRLFKGNVFSEVSVVSVKQLCFPGVSGTKTDESESVTVMEGDSVTLHTNLSDLLNDDTILWMFGPKDSLISQIKRKQDFTSIVVTDEAGFSGRLLLDQKTGSLTITNTRIRHSGQYKLTISRERTTTKAFNVTVIGEYYNISCSSTVGTNFFHCLSILFRDPI